MKRFSYQAKDKNGKSVAGKVEAATAETAARILRERGLTVIRLTPEQKFFLVAAIETFTNRVGLDDVTNFTRQFSMMVTAGLPITDALVILRAQSKPNLKPVVGQILSEVEGGSSLSSAMKKHPAVFSQVYVSLVEAGETGGVLDQILSRLADNLESQREFQAKVKGALIYPVIVVIGMVAVATVMMVLVVPRLTSLYSEFNADLPFATKVLITVSGLVQKYLFVFVVVIITAIWAFIAFSKTPLGREKVDGWKFKIPVAGNLMRQVILTEFSRTLGLLVGAGIPILEGLKVVSGVVGNVVVSKAVDRAAVRVEKGFALAYALSQEPDIFPPILYQMLSVGEETGKVDETLSKVSHVFEQESEHAVGNLTAAIEPIIMVVLGVGVGFLVIAIIMPIYNLTSQF